jgi:glycosyltransferase involved in cell wall biosynthesis
MKRKMLFVAWIAHNRRSQLIADKFQMKLYLIQSLKRWYFLAPLRYVLQAIRTIVILIRERPKVVFVQNSHTIALLAPWWKWSLPIHAFLSRRAITTIVTNEHLKSMVEAWDAKAFIIADIPTIFPHGNPFPLNGRFSVAVINTFSPDEPVEKVLKAAAALPDVQFYITGDPIRAKTTFLQNHPENVQFTGFLPDQDYFGLLRAVQAIMVLTTDNHTMQRGACEAVSLGKPIITSDWPLLRDYFHKGTIHVDNTTQGIQVGVLKMKKYLKHLEKEVLLLQKERRLEWNQKYEALTRLIEDNLEQQ